MEQLRHIFVIEDNAGDVLLIRQILQQQQIPIRVHVARDGAQAMFMLAEGRFQPDLILLDLNLPKTSGLDALRQIRLNPTTRGIPVVVLTVSRKEPDLLQSFTMGIVDYLIKPLDPDRFAQMYRKHVRENAP